jgi:Retroviral aspartyl protease
MSLMEPLCQAPLIIPQLILSLCAISIVTFNKLSEIMMPFYGGNKNRPRINVTTGDKTFNWLFDTGAVITCINANSFRQAFLGK